MTFTFRVTADVLVLDDVAMLLDAAAAQLRADGSFGTRCADGFTTQNVKDGDGEWIDPYATYKVSEVVSK